jgi:fructose-1,6-bisphosphatase
VGDTWFFVSRPGTIRSISDKKAARFVERVNRSNPEAAKDIYSLRFIGSLVTEI